MVKIFARIDKMGQQLTQQMQGKKMKPLNPLVAIDAIWRQN